MHPACLSGESRDDDQQVPDFRPTSLALSAKGARLPRRYLAVQLQLHPARKIRALVSSYRKNTIFLASLVGMRMSQIATYVS